MKVVVFTLGCKVNEVESASIMASLEKMGFETDDRLGYADIYVLNTCAVTREAERKSRQLVTRVRRFNPAAHVFVCGCASQKNAEPFKEKGVDFVCGASEKQQVLEQIALLTNKTPCGLLPPKQTKTRAFVKIQDGCNNFCSYCIIPYLRGREVSRPISEIVEEIQNTPCPEVVLNGINISSYSDRGAGLAALIGALGGVDKRLRLGSLECGIIDNELLTALKNLPDFAQQFHLSLQSGSNAVLKAMNRHYTRGEYLEKCALIYKYFPDAAITTDIISGFAAESEEDFGQTLSIIEEAGFARVHAFSYSPREGTNAYKLKDLPPDVKTERLHRLICAGRKAELSYINKFLGKPLSFIAESCDGEYTEGYSGNYIKVYVKGVLEISKKYTVTLTEIFKDGAMGTAQKA